MYFTDLFKDDEDIATSAFKLKVFKFTILHFNVADYKKQKQLEKFKADKEARKARKAIDDKLIVDGIMKIKVREIIPKPALKSRTVVKETILDDEPDDEFDLLVSDHKIVEKKVKEKADRCCMLVKYTRVIDTKIDITEEDVMCHKVQFKILNGLFKKYYIDNCQNGEVKEVFKYLKYNKKGDLVINIAVSKIGNLRIEHKKIDSDDD